jgi:hypothetical protein
VSAVSGDRPKASLTSSLPTIFSLTSWFHVPLLDLGELLDNLVGVSGFFNCEAMSFNQLCQ